MKEIIIKKNNLPCSLKARIADGFYRRFKGLMFRAEMPEDEGLIIVPCSQIHTFNMRFSIDVVYLNRGGTVLRIDEDVKPWRCCRAARGGHSVLELNSGAVAGNGIQVGDRIEY